MGGSQGKDAEPARDLPAGPEVSPTFPRRTRASISNDARPTPRPADELQGSRSITSSSAWAA